MKANEANFLTFLGNRRQFAIPIYQRTYSWTEKECRQLWDDIVRAGANEAVLAHFIGSVVYIEQGLSTVTTPSPVLVIDGQQRLATVTLLLAALAETVGDTEPVDGFSRRKLRNRYLLDQEEVGERCFKLLLSQTDKESLIAIVAGSEQPKEPSMRVTQNFGLFQSWIAAREGELSAVCKGLAKLAVVDIALNRDHDNPQLIFESMNSTGRALTQADLIRNFILMGLEPEMQTRLYKQFWRPMEVDFGQEAYGLYFDTFMRHYLTVKTGEIPNVGEVYESFKKHAGSPAVAAAGTEAMIKEIRQFARYFCAMALRAEPEPELKRAFQELRELKVDVAYPLLLELYDDYAKKVLAKDDFVRVVELVESYVFRRAVCAIPSNSMNKTFAAFGKALKKDRCLESVQAQFLLLPSNRRFPGDDEFRRELQARDLYTNRPRCIFCLRRLENYGRKEPVPVNEYTIEHILPQNESLSPDWKTALGPEWERIQQTWLHTLGNLTLTGYNAEYSDRSFKEKRDMDKGFKTSPLKLNDGLGQLDDWNEDTIISRSGRLADAAVRIWAAPNLTDDVLAAYRQKPGTTGYAIADHPFLLKSPDRELFDAFSQEALSLDPCVTREFLKYHVAFKAETNFVDVLPQANQLVLCLNMPFADINDPKGVCRDISGVGHQGNGDVRFELSRLDQLPYAMGLVRQSFERQMGNGSEG
jgi:uncharacterized protein with ParB-like and HNH nuclease domain/predicted transport protein